jgi:DNA-directed RNA polymerase specialized sigma subunit
MRFKCAHCGRQNRLIDIPLTFRQRRILKAIEQLARDLGKPVSSTRLAQEIGVSVATVKNELSHLEHMKEVCRPSGKKSGWAIAPPENLIAIAAA